MVEAWLRGPIDGVQPVLQPAAFALIQAREDIERAAAGLAPDALWATPGGAAPVGYHLRHLAASTDRLLAYSRSLALSDEQLAVLRSEKAPPRDDETAAALVAAVQASLDRALAALRAADPASFFDARSIGRAALPSTVFGVLCHIAEHASRHTGQIVTTAKIARALHGDDAASADAR